MANALARREPVPNTPALFMGVTISVAAPMQRWSLRARDPRKLEMLIGAKLPRKVGDTFGSIACLGPDEWLWRSANAPPKAMGEGQPLSIVDVTERAIGIIVEGQQARAVLNVGCPLDLEKFIIGRTTRTIFEGVEIILHRESETRWTVDVWRSFAEFLWLSFVTAAEHP